MATANIKKWSAVVAMALLVGCVVARPLNYISNRLEGFTISGNTLVVSWRKEHNVGGEFNGFDTNPVRSEILRQWYCVHDLRQPQKEISAIGMEKISPGFVGSDWVRPVVDGTTVWSLDVKESGVCGASTLNGGVVMCDAVTPTSRFGVSQHLGNMQLVLLNGDLLTVGEPGKRDSYVVDLSPLRATNADSGPVIVKVRVVPTRSVVYLLDVTRGTKARLYRAGPASPPEFVGDLLEVFRANVRDFPATFEVYFGDATESASGETFVIIESQGSARPLAELDPVMIKGEDVGDRIGGQFLLNVTTGKLVTILPGRSSQFLGDSESEISGAQSAPSHTLRSKLFVFPLKYFDLRDKASKTKEFQCRVPE